MKNLNNAFNLLHFHGVLLDCFNNIFRDKESNNPYNLKNISVWLVPEENWKLVVNNNLSMETNAEDETYKCTIVDYEFLHYQNNWDMENPENKIMSKVAVVTTEGMYCELIMIPRGHDYLLHGSYYANTWINYFTEEGFSLLGCILPHSGLYLYDNSPHINLFNFINMVTLFWQVAEEVPYHNIDTFKRLFNTLPNRTLDALDFIRSMNMVTMSYKEFEMKILREILNIKSMLEGSKLPFNWNKHPVSGRYIDFAVQKFNCVTNRLLDVNDNAVYNILYDTFNGLIMTHTNRWVITKVLIAADKENYPTAGDVTYNIIIDCATSDGVIKNRVVIEDPWKQLTHVSYLIESTIIQLLEVYQSGKLNYFYF